MRPSGFVARQHEATHDVLVKLLVVVIAQVFGGSSPKGADLVDLAGLNLGVTLGVDLPELDRVHHEVAVALDDVLDAEAIEKLLGVLFERELDAGASMLSRGRAEGEAAVPG